MFVGITTAPRDGTPLLASTLESLLLAGWDSPVVFAEPDSNLDDVRCEIVQNGERLWPWHNFLQAVRRGVESQSAKIVVCQDDIEAAVGLREFLDDTMDDRIGFWSPYTPGFANEFLPDGWGRIPPEQAHRSFGACFYAMTLETATVFLKTLPDNTARTGTDRWTGKWSRKRQCPLTFHVPALVQHVGLNSTVHPGTGLCWMRSATRFCGDARRVQGSSSNPVTSSPASFRY